MDKKGYMAIRHHDLKEAQWCSDCDKAKNKALNQTFVGILEVGEIYKVAGSNIKEFKRYNKQYLLFKPLGFGAIFSISQYPQAISFAKYYSSHSLMFIIKFERIWKIEFRENIEFRELTIEGAIGHFQPE